MIYFISNLLRTILFAFLLNDYLKRTYPEKYEDVLVTTSFNVIYAFSVVQIKFKQFQEYICKTNPRIAKLLANYNKLHDETNNYDFILDGKVIYSTTLEKFVITDVPKTHDFVIYSDCTTNEISCVNKKILNKLPPTDEKIDYEKSNIKFILCELKICDKIYKINLMDEKHNYYLVDNVIDKKFIIYYLLKYYNESIKNDDILILVFIDHEVNKCEIDITDISNYIQIKKDEYVIHR